MPRTKLYKYQSWHSEHGQTLIEEDQLYFAAADTLNDPSEARIPLRYDLATDQQVYDLFLQYAPEQYPEKSKSEHEALAKAYLEKGLFKNPSHLKWFEQFQYDKNINDFGICSLSERSNSVLMWAHYSDANKGYCVGVDYDLLQEFKKTYPGQANVLFDFYPVTYLPEFPVLLPFEMTPDELSTQPLSIKSEEWSYEHEQRLISIDGANQSLALPPGIISSVILGCSMPQPDRDEVIKCLGGKSYRVELWEAKIRPDVFGLYFESINY